MDKKLDWLNQSSFQLLCWLRLENLVSAAPMPKVQDVYDGRALIADVKNEKRRQRHLAYPAPLVVESNVAS
jgi:hypothetical protein